MNKSQTRAPQRPLRADFTALAMRRAATAKRRAHQKQQLLTHIKDFNRMKIVTFIRTVPGAALGLAVVATGSVGVYALTNWFGGNVAVTQKDTSTFSVDLSACQGNLPPGINETGDRHDIQFKIVGNPHISAGDLRVTLLGWCESHAVSQFYASKYPEANFNGAKSALSPGDPALQYSLFSATIEQTTDGAVTLRYNLGKGTATETQKALRLAGDVTAYNAGQPVALHDLKAGDKIMAVIYAPGDSAGHIEGTSILDDSNVQIKSLFKTQYNDDLNTLNYQEQNVTPLDTYNMANHKK